MKTLRETQTFKYIKPNINIIIAGRDTKISKHSLLNKILPETCNSIKEETLAQEFSSEFCEIFKNTFFAEHFRAKDYEGRI